MKGPAKDSLQEDEHICALLLTSSGQLVKLHDNFEELQKLYNAYYFHFNSMCCTPSQILDYKILTNGSFYHHRDDVIRDV